MIIAAMTASIYQALNKLLQFKKSGYKGNFISAFFMYKNSFITNFFIKEYSHLHRYTELHILYNEYDNKKH